MKRILLTGMSGVGKSTVVDELNRRGFEAVDLDQEGLSGYRELDGAAKRVVGGTSGEDWLWREGPVRDLLEGAEAEYLFVAGCAPNQREFYPYFDQVVLLTTPVDITIQRLATRTNNPYGKRPEELAKVLDDKQRFEEVLRHGADHEVDTSAPLERVLDEVLRLAVTE